MSPRWAAARPSDWPRGFVETKQERNKPKPEENAGFVIFFVLFFSGDPSCRVVFLVIPFFFFSNLFFVAKINFLCSVRGHNSWFWLRVFLFFSPKTQLI